MISPSEILPAAGIPPGSFHGVKMIPAGLDGKGKTEDRDQKSNIGGRERTEDRYQRSKRQGAEDGIRMTEGLEAEDRGQGCGFCLGSKAKQSSNLTPLKANCLYRNAPQTSSE